MFGGRFPPSRARKPRSRHAAGSRAALSEPADHAGDRACSRLRPGRHRAHRHPAGRRTVSAFQFVIENKPGAGTMTASLAVAKAPPDGYTLLQNGLALAVNPSLYKHVPYDVGKDFTPIAFLVNLPQIVVVHPSLGVRTLGEFFAKYKNSDHLIFSHPGAGTMPHLAGRAVPREERHHDARRALSRRRTSTQRCDRRPRASHRRRALAEAVHRQRPGAGAGGQRQRAAGNVAGHSDLRRGGPAAAGDRRRRLARHPGAGGPAAGRGRTGSTRRSMPRCATPARRRR